MKYATHKNKIKFSCWAIEVTSTNHVLYKYQIQTLCNEVNGNWQLPVDLSGTESDVINMLPVKTNNN